MVKLKFCMVVPPFENDIREWFSFPGSAGASLVIVLSCLLVFEHQRIFAPGIDIFYVPRLTALSRAYCFNKGVKPMDLNDIQMHIRLKTTGIKKFCAVHQYYLFAY